MAHNGAHKHSGLCEPCVLFFTDLWHPGAFPVFQGVYECKGLAEAELVRRSAELHRTTLGSKGFVRSFADLGVGLSDFQPLFEATRNLASGPVANNGPQCQAFHREHQKLHYRFLEEGRRLLA